MFKLFMLSAFITLAVAKPSGLLYQAAPVVASPVARAVVAEPLAAATPVIAESVFAPAAVSSTYREDVIGTPSVVSYASPIVAAAPAVVAAAPVAYSAPSIHPW